jgi:hypothetical protein
MTETTARNQNTVWYIDLDKVRNTVQAEKTLRHSTFAEIENETGVTALAIGQFLRGKGLSTDALVSLIKWTNKKLDTFATRRRDVVTRSETKSEQELRLLFQFLTTHGIAVEAGESPVVAVIRHMADRKETAGE